MAISQWSTTAANNGSGITGINWAEGQAPSTVNDSARETIAQIATWLGQASGAIPEGLTGVAGTNTVTATGPAQMASYVALQRFHFTPANTNTGATTLNITPSGASALGAKNIFYRGVACVGGELVQNVPAVVIYDGTQFNLLVTSLSSAATGSSLVLLGSKTLSSSASATFVHTGGTGDVTFDWTAYDEYEFHFVRVVPATGSTLLQAQISEDSGSTYKNGAGSYNSYLTIGNNSTVYINATSATVMNLIGDGTTDTQDNGTDYGLNGILRIIKPSQAVKKSVRAFLDAHNVNGIVRFDGTHNYTGDSNAWTGIKFFQSSGNLSSGVIYAYGVKKS